MNWQWQREGEASALAPRLQLEFRREAEVRPWEVPDPGAQQQEQQQNPREVPHPGLGEPEEGRAEVVQLEHWLPARELRGQSQ